MSAEEVSVTVEDVAAVEAALNELKQIDRVIRVSAYRVDADTVLVGAKISLPVDFTMRDVSIVVALAERRVRRALPDAQHVFITPDVYCDPNAAPSTSSIVTLSYD